MSWVDVEVKLPSVHAGKFRVKMQNDEETSAFFYEDVMAWIAFYGQKTSHWWEATGHHDRLDYVKYWWHEDKE